MQCFTSVLFILHILASEACFWGRQLTKEDCEDFESNNDGCVDVYQGRLQATEMTADLYKSVSRDVTVDQANVFLIPIEIARVISILIYGTKNQGDKQESLKQVGCYVNKLNTELLASIQVDYEKPTEDKPAKKMLSLQRNAFIDKELSANETFSKKALCWFDLGMLPEDFSEKNEITETVNDWAQKAAQRSRIALDAPTNNGSETVNPLAYNSDLFANDRVIIAASSHVKIPWKNGLFYKSDTVMDASFLVSPNELHNQGRKIGVRVPMMTTKGSFKVLEKEKYTALALPLDPSFINNGDLIVILPKENVPLFQVEEEVASTGINLFSLIEGFLSYKLPHKIVEVQLPRLNLQIMHEWSTPANKQIVEIIDDDDKPLEGDSVGVYQDVHLEMIETDGTAFLDADIEHRNAQAELQFIVNRPFMFMIKMDHEIIGLGRVLDPHWCKLCSPKTRTYMETDQKIVDTFETDYGMIDETYEMLKTEEPNTTTEGSTTTTSQAAESTSTTAEAENSPTTVETTKTENNTDTTTPNNSKEESSEESDSASSEKANSVDKIESSTTTSTTQQHKKVMNIKHKKDDKDSKMSSLLQKISVA